MDAFEAAFGVSAPKANPAGMDAFEAAFGVTAPKRGDTGDAFDAAFAAPSGGKQLSAASSPEALFQSRFAESFGNKKAQEERSADLAVRHAGVNQGMQNVFHFFDPINPFTDAQAFAEQRRANDAQYADNPGYEQGKLVGSAVATLPVMGVAGKALASTGNYILDAINASPSLARIGPYVSRLGQIIGGEAEGNPLLKYASRTIYGGEQGAGAAALNSSGSDEPFADQIEQGATIGGAIGVGGRLLHDAGQYGHAAARSAVDLITDTGAQRTAGGVVREFAGQPVTLDTRQIVPGSIPTMAEASGNAGIASVQRAARDLNPQPFVVREQQNAAARKNFLTSASGTAQDVEVAEQARDAMANSAINNVFAPGQTAETAPVVQKIDSILNGPSGKRDAVTSVLSNIRSKLVGTDGAPVPMDAETMYQSVRKQIGDMLTDFTSPAGKQAARELLQVQGALDKEIEKAAPGFAKYLSDYSSASKPIDSMKYLQSLNLTDSQGNIILSKVQGALKNINKLRQAAGENPAKSLATQQIDVLERIRDDLLRASKVHLGKSAGSNTVQNAATQNALQNMLPGKVGLFASKANPEAVGATVGGLIGLMSGGTMETAGGAIAGNMVGRGVASYLHSRNAIVQNRLEELMLNPSAVGAAPGPGTMNSLLNSAGVKQLAPYAAPLAVLDRRSATDHPASR